MLLGAALGALGSLAGVGLAPEPPVAVPLALGGATALVGGFAELAVRGPRAAGWVLPAGVVGTVAATALLWAAQNAQLLGTAGGWMLLAAWMTTAGTLVIPLIAAVLLAAAVAAVHPRRGALLVGLAAGVGGGLGIVGYRVVAGPAVDDNDQFERFFAIVLGAGLVGAVTVAVLALVHGVAGSAAGLLAGPIATVTTGVSYLALNTTLGGNSLPVVWPLLGAAVPTGLLLSAPAALLGLVPAPRLPSTALAAASAAVVHGDRGGGVGGAQRARARRLRAHRPGGRRRRRAGATDPARPLPHRRRARPAQRQDRRVGGAGPVQRRSADRRCGRRPDPLRDPPLAENLARATKSYVFDDPAVEEVHQHASAAAAAHVKGLTLVAEAFERNDKALLRQGNGLLTEGNAEWSAWATAVEGL